MKTSKTPRQPWWLVPVPRLLRDVASAVALGGLVIATAHAVPRRPVPVPPRPTAPSVGLVPVPVPMPDPYWSFDDAMIRQAPAGIDPRIVVAAPAGIDDRIIVPPGRMVRRAVPARR